MRVLFLLAVIFVASCGSVDELHRELQPNKKEEEQTVDAPSELMPYVEEFEYLWDLYSPGSRINNLRVRFGKITQDNRPTAVVAGSCFRQTGRSPRIVINTEIWQNITETRRKVLMFHELGHCVLFRDHIQGFNTSIMNPWVISDSKFESDEEELLAELFDPSKYNSWNMASYDPHTRCNHGE